MADHAITAHVFGAVGTQMTDVVEERGEHHFIIKAFGDRQFSSLGHVLDLRHRLADVITSTKAFIQRKHPVNDLRMPRHHISSSHCATLRSASAGPTLMPTPVCINATLSPGAGRSNENGPGPREP